MKTFLMAILLVLASLIPQAVAQQGNADWLKELDGTKFAYEASCPSCDPPRSTTFTILIKGNQAIEMWTVRGAQQVTGPMDIQGDTFKSCDERGCLVYVIAHSGIAITKTFPNNSKWIFVRQ